jgi:hypothetical protein
MQPYQLAWRTIIRKPGFGLGSIPDSPDEVLLPSGGGIVCHVGSCTKCNLLIEPRGSPHVAVCCLCLPQGMSCVARILRLTTYGLISQGIGIVSSLVYVVRGWLLISRFVDAGSRIQPHCAALSSYCR